MNTEVPAAEGGEFHILIKREGPNWFDRNRMWVARAIGLILAVLIIVLALWLQPTPAKTPSVHCTVKSGTSLVDCFGTNQNAYQASIAFADRYNLPIQAKLIGTSETTTLKPANALKLDTSLVQISVAVNPGDEVIVPTDSQGSYVIDQSTYIHNGKVVSPAKH